MFDLAVSGNLLDGVEADVSALQAMIADSPDLVRLLESPALSRAEQGRAVGALASSAKFSDLTCKFLGTLAHNRRLADLSGILDDFGRRLAARRGEISAEVASAVALTPAQAEAVANALKTAFGGDVSVQTVVDPGLLGGLVVKVGSRMVDSSLKTRLQHLKLAMKGVG